MAKYDPLRHFLKRQTADALPVSFAEVEEILGAKLPRSAFRYREWWANDAKGHVHAKAWLGAGFQTVQVDMEARKLTFRRMPDGGGPFRPAAAARGGGFAEGATSYRPLEQKMAQAHHAGSCRHPAFGAMKDTFVMEEGLDPTTPAMPDWADQIDAQYGPESE